MRLFLVTLLALVVPGVPSMGSALAQSPGTCDAPEARAFDFWVGDWDISQRILRQDGTWLEAPAKTSVAPALDECALVEHWEGKVQFFWEGMRAPEAMKGLSVRAWDPRAKEWSIYWMDTRSRRFDTPYVGHFADGRGEFFREWEGPDGPRVGRISFADITPDAVNWSLAISSDGRRTWTTLWTMAMRRAGRTSPQ